MLNSQLSANLSQSQTKYAANIDLIRKSSDYIGTNFKLKDVREVRNEDQDYDTNARKPHADLGDYYAGLRAKDDGDISSERNMFIKGPFKENIPIFLLHCLLLLIALVCGSSVGVFYFYIHPGSQLLKASWRLLFLVICISPLAIIEYFKEREKFLYSREVLWNGEILKKIFIASIGHTIWTIALVIAVNHTSMAQAYLLISLHPIVLMLFKMYNKSNILRLEIIGAICVLIGAFFIFLDNDIESFGDVVDLNIIDTATRNSSGNLVAIIGSIGGAIYYSKNYQLKYEYPFFLGILMVSFLGFIEVSILAMITEGATFSFNHEFGIFGFFTSEWIGTYVLTILVTGFGTYIGNRFSQKYFEPLLLLIVFNMEPVCATFLVVVMGWQSIPAVMTIIAFLLIIPGTLCVILGNREVEVREYDIGKDDFGSMPLISFNAADAKLSAKFSMMRSHYRKTSLIPPISLEK